MACNTPTLHGHQMARIICSMVPWAWRSNDLMPIYEYECQKCKSHTELFQKMSDKPPVKCRKCGGRLEKQISASAIQFKGSGWYVTDYAGNGRKAAEKAESDAASAGDKKPDKKSNDSSPANKKSNDGSPAKKTSEKASSKTPSSD